MDLSFHDDSEGWPEIPARTEECVATESSETNGGEIHHLIFPISLSGEFQTKNQNEEHKMNDNKQRVLHA
jgi:hypothetical protein